MLQDDYIITSAAESHPSDRPAFLRGIPESIIQLLRVARYNETVARELGNALTPTGQLANDAAKPIISAHARKIDEMELAAQSLPASNPVFPQVLISRMRLYGYALQMTPAPDFGEKATIQSFTTATRLLNHCRSLSLDTIASWPRSTFFGFGLAVVCCSDSPRVTTLPTDTRAPVTDGALALARFGERARVRLAGQRGAHVRLACLPTRA